MAIVSEVTGLSGFRTLLWVAAVSVRARCRNGHCHSSRALTGHLDHLRARADLREGSPWSIALRLEASKKRAVRKSSSFRRRAPPAPVCRTASTMAVQREPVPGRDAELPLAQIIHVRDPIRIRIDEADHGAVLAGALDLQRPHGAPSPDPVAERLQAARGLVIRIAAPPVAAPA